MKLPAFPRERFARKVRANRSRARRGLIASSFACEAIQEAEQPIEDEARVRGLDLPAPRVGNVQGGADLGGAAVRHHEEAADVAAVAIRALGQVVRDAVRAAVTTCFACSRL